MSRKYHVDPPHRCTVPGCTSGKVALYTVPPRYFCEDHRTEAYETARRVNSLPIPPSWSEHRNRIHSGRKFDRLHHNI